jgi:hypothetical protein
VGEPRISSARLTQFTSTGRVCATSTDGGRLALPGPMQLITRKHVIGPSTAQTYLVARPTPNVCKGAALKPSSTASRPGRPW